MSLLQQAEALAAEAATAFDDASSEAALFQAKSRYLGRKGALAALLKEIPGLPPEERRTTGAGINKAKQAAEAAFEARLAAVKEAALAGSASALDVTLPARPRWRGHLHPVMLAWQSIADIFSSMGYAIHEGPEVDTDWHSFEALNIPPGHPAREMQDTFYIQEGVVLRPHTSPVQIRTMLHQPPPLRMICPGAVYRRDNDNTHTPMFHQVEGLVVDTTTTMADLKGTLAAFARAFFGPGTDVRFRASFFPFTEPSAEVDVSCQFCDRSGAAGCRVCKDTGWLEVLGAGMVDPEVFKAVGIDPDVYQGFAFGMGIDRLAMLRYGIDDLRLLFDNDLRMLEQF
jgi:phenylalanyl-tRNA synthetase alpha chain